MVGELHCHLPYIHCYMGSVSASFPHSPCLNWSYEYEEVGVCNLRQGNRTVAQYVDEFSKLSRYAPDDVATYAAKHEKFMEGLMR